MNQYEYKIKNLDYGTIEQQEATLNELGAQGYKIVAYQGMRLIFCRLKLPDRVWPPIEVYSADNND